MAKSFNLFPPASAREIKIGKIEIRKRGILSHVDVELIKRKESQPKTL